MRRGFAGVPVRVFVALAACALSARADVVVVDPTGGGDFTQIQPAIDAALDGDTILVRTGSYPGFQLGQRDLRIVAAAGANALVLGEVRVLGSLADQEVVLVGLKIRPPLSFNDGDPRDALVIEDALGSVRIEACELRGAMGTEYSTQYETGGQALRATDCADLSVARSMLFGGEGASSFTGYGVNQGGHGLHALQSVIALHDCVLVGGAGGEGTFTFCDIPGDGGHGARVQGTFIYASGSRFVGGPNSDDGFSTCPTPGHGLMLIGAGTQARLLDVQLVGASNPCGPDGQGLVQGSGATVGFIAGAARSMSARNPVREGQPTELVFEGLPQDEVYVLVSDGPGFQFDAGLRGVLLLDLPLAQGRRFLGTIPASGRLVASIPIPLLPPGEESRTLHLQALIADTAARTWIGSPSTLVVLDAAF